MTETINNVLLNYNTLSKVQNKNLLIYQVTNLYKTILDSVNNFDILKEYDVIYGQFRESINKEYMHYFSDILDATMNMMFKEIYDTIDDFSNISILFNPITKASASDRKHFEIAKDIAIKAIKIYSINVNSKKTIISYVDDYLPNNYTQNQDIDKVVWYFIVCITTLNQNFKRKKD
ncbi:MAG: hypothetical protein PHE54_05505 [Bacilli bacterium]|nr:hypothetical protein [Bacilli bacterium]